MSLNGFFSVSGQAVCVRLLWSAMSHSGLSSKEQDRILRAQGKALNRVVDYLESRDWDFKHFSNTFYDTEIADEPAGFHPPMSPEALAPFVDSFTGRPDGIISYELNAKGLDQLSLEFEGLGEGRLIARLYNDTAPAGSRLAETYLVSLIADPGHFENRRRNGKLKVSPRDFERFDLTLVGTDDADGSETVGIGSLALDSGILSISENSHARLLGLTASAEMVLTAQPF